MTSVLPVQCRACAHLRGRSVCDAFPGGIPDAIELYGADHREPHAGDRGVRFQLAPTPAAREAFADWQRTFGVVARH